MSVYIMKVHSRLIPCNVLLIAIISSSFLLAPLTSASQLYDQCSACHMINGAGNPLLEAPAIAGLDENYILRQLHNFKEKLRGHSTDDTHSQAMQAVATTLTNNDIKSLSKFISKMPIPKIQQESQSTGFRGRGLYSGCSSCHGADGNGNKLLGAPRIAHQHISYLTKQLHKYRNDIRGYSSGDNYGSQMRAMAKDINNNTDIKTLSNYISTLGK